MIDFVFTDQVQSEFLAEHFYSQQPPPPKPNNTEYERKMAETPNIQYDNDIIINGKSVSLSNNRVTRGIFFLNDLIVFFLSTSGDRRRKSPQVVQTNVQYHP